LSVTDAVESSRPTAGVDWASADHAVSIVNANGEQTGRFPVAHDMAGLRTLVRRLLAAGVAEVGIERPDGPVVDALRQAGLVVYVIPPGQLRNLRSRYGSAGNKDDRFDACAHRPAPAASVADRPARHDRAAPDHPRPQGPRPREGLAAARSRGRKGCRRPVLTETQLTGAREVCNSNRYTFQQIADTVGCSHITLYRALSRTSGAAA